MPAQFSFLNLTIHLYGIIIAFAILLGYLLAKIRVKKYKIPSSLFEDPILVLPLFLAILLARLYHVIDYRSYYLQNPLLVFSLNNGGLGIWGAMLGIILGFWVIAKVRKINFLSLLDLIAPSLLLGQAIGRIGNFINQEGFGPPTNLPWGVYIAPQNRPETLASFSHFHPTFFYEAIIDLIFFIILIILSRKFKKPGQIFGLYLILYASGRFVVEFWRIDTAQIGTVKMAQVLSIAAILIGFYLLRKAIISFKAN